MSTTRRAAMALLPALGLAREAEAQPQAGAYPNRPIRLIVPFTPGGSVDLMARAFCRRWGGILNQTIVIENKPGATTIIGTTFVARAEPDGYTVLSGGTSVGLNRHLFRNLPYDPDRDLVVAAPLTTVHYLLVVDPRLPARTVPELIAPATTPAAHVRVMNQAAGEALRDAALRRVLEEQGFAVAQPMSPEEAKRGYDATVEKLARVVREVRISVG